MVKKYTFRGF